MIIWVVALVLMAGIYKIESVQPALSEILRPVYVVIIAVTLLVTWRWFRTRSGGERHERRHGDRRHSDRRDGE